MTQRSSPAFKSGEGLLPASEARFSKLEGRVDLVEREAAAHRRDDEGQFVALRQDIADMGSELGAKIEAMGTNLQGQITALKIDKAKAEGKAEGIASVKAAISAPRWWHPLALGAAGILATATIGLVAWLARTLYDQQEAQIESLRNRPVAAVTVMPSQTPMAPTPTPLLPGPPDPTAP